MTRYGMTLTELLTVMAVMAMLIGIAVPAARAILESFETSAGVTNVISAALANARAIALKNSQYTGVRFQQDLMGNQYMILIEYNNLIGSPVNAFKAVQGRKPMRLPGNIGLMDMIIVERGAPPYPIVATDRSIVADGRINDQFELNDTTSFSIIFSPSGKLTTRYAHMKNRDKESPGDDSSNDDVFNTLDNVDINGIGQFVQDDYWDDPQNLGWGPENSRRGFVIYNKSDFNKVSPNRRWSNYLRHLEVLYVNPHSGRIIN